MTHPDAALLARIERYYDAVPRAAADTEECGPFTLFVSRAPWPYYARPRLGLLADITADDVRALRAFQVGLGVPESIEWVTTTTPSLGPAATAAGLALHDYPLMALTSAVSANDPEGVDIRRIGADDPALGAVLGAVHRGFGSVAPPGEDEVGLVRERVRTDLQVLVGAFDGQGGAVGGGSHQPVEDVTELVGIAVVPEARRRGVGAALTDALVTSARAAGVDVVFLSAGDDDVARTYARVGFRAIGSAGGAGPPQPPDLAGPPS